MGDIKKKKNKFRRPKKPFDKARIEEEKKIMVEYGLKNKKEIWKAESEVSKIRRRAKALIPRSLEEKEAFFNKLTSLGLKAGNTAEALALTKKDILNRRIQTMVYKKGIVRTPREARQMIVHKKIAVNGKIVNIPSYFISSTEENSISKLNKGAKQEND